MPRNTREYLLRYADQADNNMDRTIEKLREMAETYGDTHPDYTKFITLIAQQQIMIQDQLREFRHNHM